MRLVSFSAALLMLGSFGTQAAVIEAGLQDETVQVATAQPSTGLDPIVTGQRVTEAHLRDWEKRREMHRSCEACGLDQPYPGDTEAE